MVALDSSHAAIRPSFFGADASDPATPDEANDNNVGLHGPSLPDMIELRLVLECLGISNEERLALAARAEFHGTTFQAELLATGRVTEKAFFAEMAREIGVEYVGRVDPRPPDDRRQGLPGATLQAHACHGGARQGGWRALCLCRRA